MLILYMEDIFWRLNEVNSSLQIQDMNIVFAKHHRGIHEKICYLENKYHDAQFQSLFSFDGKEID